MLSSAATSAPTAAPSHRARCLHGSSLTDALALAAELAQWAEDVLGAPGPLSEAAAMVYDVYAYDQTPTKSPLDVTLATLLADGHSLSAEAWDALQPEFVAARRALGAKWDADGDEDDQRGEWRDLPAVGARVVS